MPLLSSVARNSSIFLATIACVLLAAGRVNAAQITLAWDANPEPNIAGYVVEYGPSFAPFTLSVDVGNTTTWIQTNASSGVTYSFRVIAYNTFGEYSDPSAAVSGTADGPLAPTLTADRAALAFAMISGAPQLRTAPQTVRLTQNGTGAVTWTASASASWLQVSPASGSGSGALTVSLVPGSVPPVGGAATLTITSTGTSNSIAPVAVTVTVLSQTAAKAPAGAVDTPANNATGITGSLAITGWAIDDVDVSRVRILRDPVAGESGMVYIGDGMLVEDARPDIAALYPTLPWSYRAGWGYLLLTNMLPGQGNGTFRFYAYADDPDGHTTLLGTRTVTCANSSATTPFGAIDTPAPGQTVAGGNYVNFGWVLSKGPRRADPPGGGTVTAFIDGLPVGSPGGWGLRTDLASLFPAATYPGINTAAGALAFDTTTLPNGIHTIQWAVTDNQGGASGIGSRYFRVFNAGSSLTLEPPAGSVSTRAELAGAMIDGRAVEARRGYVLDTPLSRHEADANGRVTLQSEELDRIEVTTHGATEGYMVSGQDLRPLPVGSRLDPATGTFIWQPGVGFVGSYDLVFLRQTPGGLARQDVRIVLNPKGSDRVGPQVVVDIAGDVVAGWAADLDSPGDRGIDFLHVWAYPADGGGPVFVGEPSYGGARPDVAAVYGERFRATGYGLRVQGLAPGTYDLAIFAWSSSRHGWLPAKVVRVTVK